MPPARTARVVYAANVRVGTNAGSVGEMLRLAMPEASIQATPMNNLVLLTGTVASPTDVEEAQRLVQAYVGEGTQVVSRLRSATPLQVMLKVKIAEVSRSLVKQIGVNLLTRDGTGGFQFGIGQGNAGTFGQPRRTVTPQRFPRASISAPPAPRLGSPASFSASTYCRPWTCRKPMASSRRWPSRT